jgi:hypothetical protein
LNAAYLKIVALIVQKLGPIRIVLLVVAGIGAAVTCVAIRATNSPVPLLVLLGFLLVLVLLMLCLPRDVRVIGVGERRKPRPILSEDQVTHIHLALTTAANEIARILKVKPIEDVRACLFGMSPDGYLRMIREVSIRMTPDEFTVKLPVGYWNAGQAFADGQPRIAIDPQPRRASGATRFRQWPWEIAHVFVNGNGGRSSASSTQRGSWYLEPGEAAKLHNRLSWIISVPIPRTPEEPKWVMNVDGLQMRSERDLQREVVIGLLLNWGRIIEGLLRGAPAQRSQVR